MSTHPVPVLELAVFTVRAPDSFPAIQHRTHDALATLAGHRTSLRLRGMTDGLFADLVAWDSLEAAQQASNTVREDPRFAALMTSITEIKLYAHYQLGVDTAALLAELRRAPVVEVAAYAVRDVAVQLDVHGRVHDALRALAGHRGGAPAHQVEDPGQFADLIGWENPEAHQRAGADLQERGDLAGFFSGIGDMKVFELFSVLG
ncbi:MAG: hypothetical protein INH41_01190 [Myxococcaceae bacterium]|jgi:hypothetical protein|nr:hypothetical protein [Myxococcaceae bacterium]